MASAIDPITGLPLDFTVPDQYQIPLNSQPALAPEWNPQGRVNTTLFPDNIPSVFATLQAQNELNPSTVQAGTMDGNGNLNVNVKAGGGGGGSAGFPFTSSSSGDAPLATSLSQWDTITPAPTHIYRLYFSVYAGFNAHFAADTCDIYVSLGDYNATLLTPVWSVRLYAGPDPADGTLRYAEIDMLFPGGIVIPGTFSSGNPFTVQAFATQFNTVLKSTYWWD